MLLVKKFTITILGMLITNVCLAQSKDFIITIEDKIKVYLLPDINSSNLIILPIGNRIKIISNINQEIEIGAKKGNWIYIDSQRYRNIKSGPIKGWVQSIYIAERKEFKKINKFDSYHLIGNVGDSVMDFTFNNDGTFKQKLYNKNNEKLITGNIYQFGNVIFTESKDYIDFFYFDEASNLLSVYPDSVTDKPIQAKRLDDQSITNTTVQIYTLTGDNVNVRAEAAANGAVLVKLSRGAKVTLLKRSDAALTVGDKKGYWAYIDTGVTNKAGDETVKGWVFDYYLKEEK